MELRGGDRVGVVAGNRIELLDLFLACRWIGAILVPINVALRGAQLVRVLENAQPTLLVVESHVESQIAPEMVPASARGRLVLDTAQFAYDSEPAAPASVSPGDTLTILYTSGTTGPSNRVVCPHAQLYWFGRLTARHLGLGHGDVC
jgi:carnitine-CoA ligase